MKNNNLRFLIILFVLFSYSCHESSIDPDNKPKKIKFDVAKFIVYPSIKPKSKNIKLYIYVLTNISCPSCLINLKRMDSFYSNIPQNEKQYIAIRPICYSDDNFESFKYLIEKNRYPKFNYPLFLDTSMSFIKSNRFLIEENGGMYALTNSKDSILVLGSPLKNKEVNKAYDFFFTGK